MTGKQPLDLAAIEATHAQQPTYIRADVFALTARVRVLEAGLTAMKDAHESLLACLQRAAHEHTDLRAVIAEWNSVDTSDAADNDEGFGPSRRFTREEGYDVPFDADDLDAEGAR